MGWRFALQDGMMARTSERMSGRYNLSPEAPQRLFGDAVFRNGKCDAQPSAARKLLKRWAALFQNRELDLIVTSNGWLERHFWQMQSILSGHRPGWPS